MQGYVILALAAGIVLPIQALINGRLSSAVGSPFLAANISFVAAALGLILIQLVLRQPLPAADRLSAVPVWAWFGGLLGVVYVVGAIISVGHIGTTTAICLIIAGQMAGALLVDHFGLLGANSNPISVFRLFGAALVACGAVIVVRA
ncbi:DMT family transporter [Dongia sp.]|uniref:DMT family transporter n=1 Tax=Dongia sp. TaxID=1977262 RepID=UPI0035B2761A